MSGPKTPDWSKADPNVVSEIIRQSELRLQTQCQIATQADQRATVLAGIYAAAATGVIVAVATTPKSLTTSVEIGAGFAIILFLLGAFFCVLSIMPVTIRAPGTDPQLWYADVLSARTLVDALGEQAQNYDEMIRENRATMAKNGARFSIGAFLGISAPFVGVIAALLALLPTCPS
jgi:hypothetical protein